MAEGKPDLVKHSLTADVVNGDVSQTGTETEAASLPNLPGMHRSVQAF